MIHPLEASSLLYIYLSETWKRKHLFPPPRRMKKRRGQKIAPRHATDSHIPGNEKNPIMMRLGVRVFFFRGKKEE